MANRFKLLIAASLGLFAACANAGYAQLAPPPGWSTGHYAPSANDATFGRVIHAPNGPTATVGGQAVRMPAAYRLAANAPRIAAAAIFMNPYVRTAVGIATWLGIGKFIYDESRKVWTQTIETTEVISPGYEYTNGSNARYPTANEARQARVNELNTQFGYSRFSVGQVSSDIRFQIYDSVANEANWFALGRHEIPCPVNTVRTPAGCVYDASKIVDVNKEQFEQQLPSTPMPDTVPLELPKPTPLPVEQPIINPEPGFNPQHRPLFVPTGNPVPNPQYDPNSPPGPNNQPWIQPGTKITPSPTFDQPWRVDIQPVNRPVSSPEPMPGPEPIPTPTPNPDPNNPNPDPDSIDKPKPEEQQSLCEKHPDIIACQKLEMPEDPGKLPAKEVEFEMKPETGFAGSAACPAPVQATLNGKIYGFSWQPFCNSLDMIKPLLLAFAWLSAAFILLGARGN